MVNHYYIPQDTDLQTFLTQLRADMAHELGFTGLNYSSYALEVTSGYVEEWHLGGERRCHIQFFEAKPQWEMLVYFRKELQDKVSAAVASAQEKTRKSKPKEHFIEID